MAKWNYRDRPLIVIASAVAATILLCLAVSNHLHNLVIEQKDGTIESKQADIDSLASENESLRRRLQGDVILVSTNDLETVRKDVADIEASLSDKLASLANSLSQLDEVKRTLDASLQQTTPAEFATLRRVANIRPNGRKVDWTGDRKMSGAGIALSGPSSISKALGPIFEAFNNRETQQCQQLLHEVAENEPVWPYSYMYMGLNSLNAGKFDKAAFEKAVAAFQRFSQVGIVEPEHLLYEAMSHTFLGEYEEASKLLEEVSTFSSKPDDIILIAVNAASPKELLTAFGEMAEKVGSKVAAIRIP